jgi:protein TonB
MSAAVRATVTDTDRLALALFLATAVHGMVILGIGFGAEFSERQRSAPSLDIVLVQATTDEPQPDAELMAQANQRASGSREKADQPSAPFTAPNPLPTQGIAPVQQRAASRPAQAEPETRTLTAIESETTTPSAEQTRTPRPSENPSGRELADRSLEMARLAAQIAEREQQYAKRPRTHYIDAAGARSAVEAGYIEAWVNKVERVGNLNYPDAALRQRLDGRLILNVLLDRSGKVVSVDLARSSGHRVLDDAAMRIVRDASPYAEFPVEMRKQYDRLMITRTWIFNSSGSGSFSSGR